nr:hypothetical protein [Edwardsiella ictaluri]
MTITVTPFIHHTVDMQPKFALGQRIDAGGRLIQKQDIRLMHQGAGECHALSETQRQRIRRLAQDRREAERPAACRRF